MTRRRPTARQIDVLRAVVDAGSIRAAAHALGISEDTAKAHLRAMYDRLGVDTAAQAAYWLGMETAGPTQKE